MPLSGSLQFVSGLTTWAIAPSIAVQYTALMLYRFGKMIGDSYNLNYLAGLEDVYGQMKKDAEPGEEFSVTGHSLGGGLSALLGL